jgi:HK97 family phage major capsid protein
MKYTDVLKCLTGVAGIVLARKARWWLHPTMLARFIGIQDAIGRPIFQTALEAPNYGSIGSLFGYPVTMLMAGPNTDSAGQPVAAFGDPNCVVVGVRTDFNFEASDDFKFDQFERAFRGTGRAGVMGRRTDGAAVLKLAGS